jgi:hypothetical protein
MVGGDNCTVHGHVQLEMLSAEVREGLKEHSASASVPVSVVAAVPMGHRSERGCGSQNEKQQPHGAARDSTCVRVTVRAHE